VSVWKEAVEAYLKVNYQRSIGETEENHKTHSPFRKAGQPGRDLNCVLTGYKYTVLPIHRSA